MNYKRVAILFTITFVIFWSNNQLTLANAPQNENQHFTSSSVPDLFADFINVILGSDISNQPAINLNKPTTLFQAANDRPDHHTFDAPEVVQGQYVTINTAALQPATSQIYLNLFDNSIWQATQHRVESNPSGSYTWIGYINDLPYSSVVFVVRDNMVTGKIDVPQATYMVYPLPNGIHVITEIDAQMIDPEIWGDSIQPPAGWTERRPFHADGPDLLTTSDDGSVLDVMVVYTPAARIGAGGTAAIESLIELGVAETNRAFEQSGVMPRMFLVHMAEVIYTESGSASTDLFRLTDPANGYMDQVHIWRNQYNADFVKLIIETGGAGVAWLQTTINPSFESYAFSVTQRNAISPNYTFAHELGHNMGLRHDWYVDDDTTPFTHAHGYTNYSQGWRTIMSYNNICADYGSGFCNRLLHFSNPTVTFNGDPLGVPTGTASNCVVGSIIPNPEGCDADSAQVLNFGAANNAGFRLSSKTWLGNTTAWDDGNNWSDGLVPRFMDDVIIPSSPTGGSFPITGGTATVRNLVVQTGANVTMSGGTLRVHGHWDEQGTGVFAASGGVVIFEANIPQTINQNSASTFNHVEIGNGVASTIVIAESDITIAGDFTIKNNASFRGSSHTITVAGNWDEQTPAGFSPDNSTVVFNGSDQTLSKIASTTLIDESFDAYTGNCCGWGGTYAPPLGWSREVVDGNGWLFGDINGAGAMRWSTSTDGWLFTNGVDLSPSMLYSLSYTYRVHDQPPWGNLQNQTYEIYVGNAPNSGSMTMLVDTVTTNSTTAATRTANFTVADAGIYYVGLRVTAPVAEDIAIIDDLALSGSGKLDFYNLEIGGESVTISQNTAVANNLTTHYAGLFNLNGQALTVEGQVINNGALMNAGNTPNGSTTPFLHIQNAAATISKYRGVDISPAGSGLGNTVVTVFGNQTCSNAPTVQPVLRCFEISPSNTNPATVRFYYLATEANNNIEGSVNVYYWSGDWILQTGTYTYSNNGNPRFVQVTGVINYTQFMLDDDESPPIIPTNTPLPTATSTHTPLPTVTPTHTPLPTATSTHTPSPTATPTHTPSPTATPTHTPSPTATPPHTPLPTATPTHTPLPTATSTHTPLPTATSTHTPLPTATPTHTPLPTATPTHTPLPTATPTHTSLPTASPTGTWEPTVVPTNTPLPTATPTNMPIPTVIPTGTWEPTVVPTSTPPAPSSNRLYLPLVMVP